MQLKNIFEIDTGLSQFALSTCADMSPDQQNGGGAFRRFSGVGNNAPQDFRAWKKWAKAKLVVEKSMGMTPGAVGPMLYTLLD